MIFAGDLLVERTHFSACFWHVFLSMKSRPNIKVDICFCAGILFSTLVFGPACGFILGSLCTKFYVDAVFIDTSEFTLSLFSIF